ncbi:MAG: 4Fe-4S ferredoxin N-terminal domain-containing protein, partial [Dehalococcoidia bacterium]|nr:4Fe-4S ferredoxin N-terminal domain-containing protein [Dehalococcoidia bacterium]
METEAKTQGPQSQQALEQAESSFLETPRNPELAREVAKDAQRVVLGELSEEEFYDKYHKAYLQEFGMDNRPDKRRGKGGDTGSNSGSSSLETQPQGPGKRSMSRRRAFLMLAGGGSGAAALALTTSPGSSSSLISITGTTLPITVKSRTT